MNIIYISAIISTFAELFPSFGLSYFLPRSGDTEFYDSKIVSRIVEVVLVWFPIAYILYNSAPIRAIIAISSIMLGFYLKRFAAYHVVENRLSGLLYFIGLVIIVTILNEKGNMINNVLSGSLILLGGYLISIGRQGELTVDIMGRILFTIGYFYFISNLVKFSNVPRPEIFNKVILPIGILYLVYTLFQKKCEQKTL